MDLFHSKLPKDWGSGGILTFVSPFPLTVGVCNTDNFSLLSITIDYGPFGFMDSYDPSECSTWFFGFVLFFYLKQSFNIKLYSFHYMKIPFIISRKTISMCTVWRALGKKIASGTSFMIHYVGCIQGLKVLLMKYYYLTHFHETVSTWTP